MPDPIRPAVSSTGSKTASVPGRHALDSANAGNRDDQVAVKRPSSKTGDKITAKRAADGRDRDGFPE